MKQMKKRILSMLLALVTLLTILPTAAFAANSTGTGITPVTDPNLWTTRLTSTGQPYSYRPPTAAGKQLYCMDLGYSYRYGTASFLNSYTYTSATGADADALWEKAIAKTGLGEMDAITKENVKWMMSYIADYTGEIPGSLFMALQTYIWDNQSDKSAGGDPSGDIDAGGFANADTHDTYVGYYNWLLGQKANEDAGLQKQVEQYAAEGKQASIVEDEASKWAVLAISGTAGRQSFFAYHSTRKVVADDKPQGGNNPPAPVAGDGDITFQKVIAGTDRGLDGAVYNVYRDGQIVGSDVTSSGGVIEVNDITTGLWSFVEVEAPEGYALDSTPHSVYVDVTDGDKQYMVTASNAPLPSLKITKADAQTYGDGENPVVLKSEFLLSLCEQLMGEGRLSAKEKSIIDRCTAQVYRDYIRGGYQGSAPTLRDFHAELLRQTEPEARDVALAIELFTEGSLNTFAKPTNVDTDSRILCYDIRDLGKQLQPVGMLVVLDSIFNRIIRNRALGKNTWLYVDEIYLLFQHEYSANFLFTLWKRVRKYGACATGITQNIDDLLQSHIARTMLANSEFLVMLNQAATDRAELAKLLNISDNQLSYITNVESGRGLIKCGSAIVPFMDSFPRGTKLYQMMTTRPADRDMAA